MSFYNTTHETGDTLKESHHKASSQESKILNYFLRSGEPLSPSMILKQMRLNWRLKTEDDFINPDQFSLFGGSK